MGFLKLNQTINADLHCQQLDKSHRALQGKCPRMVATWITLHHMWLFGLRKKIDRP